jgi:hypothetical protein
MRRGAWHQCGDRSQRLVEEQLQANAGVGVILSPRDLSRDNAIRYAQSYHALGAHVLLDPQFYVPDFNNEHLGTYSMSQFRTAVSQLRQLSEEQLADFANTLRVDHAELNAEALIAPALPYEAARPDIVELNARIFEFAKQVGNDLNIPTYATVVLARSVTSSDQTLGPTLSHATSLDADGWYFAFEFEEERIPSARETIRRCCVAGLTLACTGKPVLHAFAGPLGILSFGCGVHGVGVGHSQNLWKFTRDRWAPPSGQGGGGAAPPRFFSGSLWGTIVYPDETAQLAPALRAQVLVPSTPFCQPVLATPPVDWPRWDAGKHLVHALSTAFDAIASNTDAEVNANSAVAVLQQAVQLHQAIRAQGIVLSDSTDAYQASWRNAMSDMLTTNQDRFAYLKLLAP